MIPQQIGRYSIKSEIGRGGMATVYLAQDPRFRRDVALKVMAAGLIDNPTFLVRFEREAQVIASLEHPAIVPVYDFGDEGGAPYLVMRYMPGGSLSDRLRRGPLTFTQAAEIISRLAPALDAVHARSIVHRDLKPGNILFDGYGNAYLSDFGIARLAQSTVTLTGDAIIGTPSYMSPEQVRGEPDIDGRSDIYALGAILFEMLTGKQPYEATTPMGIAMKQITEPVPRIRAINADLPEEIETVIEKAMAKERQKRFASAGEMASLQSSIASHMPAGGNSTVLDAPFPANEEKPAQSSNAAPANLPQPAVTPLEVQPAPPSQPPAERDSADRASAPAAPQPQLQPQRSPRREIPSSPLPAAAAAGQRPGRLPRLSWILGGLVLLAGLCVVIGLGLAGGATLMPGLLGTGNNPPATPAAQNEPALNTPITDLTDLTKAPETSPTVPPVGTADTAGASVTPSTESTNPPRETDLFQDDFSDSSTGWFTGEEQGSNIYYDMGGYRILVDQPNVIAWATPNLRFTDVSIEVDATKIAGADENLFGILCRYQDERNFYILVIGSDGYYEIGKYKDGSYYRIKDTAGFSGQIHKGRTTNRLRADCIGNSLTMYVNNLRLVKVDDNEFTSGDVGLTAAAFQIGNTNILFDNFVARKP